MSMDWNDVLADYEGKFSYIIVLMLKWQQNLEKCPIIKIFIVFMYSSWIMAPE